MKKLLISTLLLATAAAALPTSADARPWGRHHHRHQVCHWGPHHHRICGWR